MTALRKYRKLEGLGLWAGSVEDQRREVIVSFGEATLVIADSRSMKVLSHWSLPAVVQHNPGSRPALYSPDGAMAETLEIDDPLLIDALKELHAALQPRPNWIARYGRAITGALALGAVGLGALLVPPALVVHTAGIVPMAKRVDLSERLRFDLQTEGGRECHSAYGDPALGVLQRALFQTPARIIVMQNLPQAQPRVLHGPGRLFILDARLLDLAESPEALAGALIIAAQRAAQADPLEPLLRHAGAVATFRLLTSGDLPPRAATGYGRVLVLSEATRPDIEPLLDRFAQAELSTRALIENPSALDPMLEDLADDLREGDPMARDQAPRELLTDGQWVSLLNICAT